MITPRPDFIDSPYFVSDESGWRLLNGAPREVRKEFKAFTRLTREPFIDKKIDLRDWDAKLTDLTAPLSLKR